MASGAVSHLWERDCSLQRSHQKLIEVAPSPWLPAALRDPLLHAACTMAASAKLRGLTTFEFLFDARDRFFFIEANPRLQVEHTITEAVTGVDLVQAQLRIAQGATLAQLGLTQAQVPPPQGFAIQLRVNAEQLQPDGSARPAVGTLSAYEPPAGPGVRVDGCGFAGAVISPAYDSLLAKLVVHAPTGGMDAALRRARRAAAEFIVQGVATSLPLLASLLARPEMAGFQVHTRFIEAHAGELIAASGGPSPDITPALPVLEDGLTALRAPLHGTVVSFEAVPGQTVAAGAPLVILEAMKMQHVLEAASGGIVRELRAAVGQTVAQDDLLVLLEAADVAGAQGDGQAALDLDRIRPDLAEAIARHAMGLDEARPAAVARRHASGRTARENVADLVDAGSFVEYGPVVIAAQRRRRALDDLIARTPADGMVGASAPSTATCSTRRAAPGRDVVRLHGARRHPGHAEPPQEGPPVRGRRADAAAGGVLHRGRWRAARRHRPDRRQRPRLPGVHVLRRAERAGAARRHQRGTASPATPRSSAAATSSSPPRTRTSAWAARR
jgi:biotin carboxyl carrier protein